MTKSNLEKGIPWRFGPDWPGQRCGAKTRKGTPCQRPAYKRNGRCSLHGGRSYRAQDRGWPSAAYSGSYDPWQVHQGEAGSGQARRGGLRRALRGARAGPARRGQAGAGGRNQKAAISRNRVLWVHILEEACLYTVVHPGLSPVEPSGVKPHRNPSPVEPPSRLLHLTKLLDRNL